MAAPSLKKKYLSYAELDFDDGLHKIHWLRIRHRPPVLPHVVPGGRMGNARQNLEEALQILDMFPNEEDQFAVADK